MPSRSTIFTGVLILGIIAGLYVYFFVVQKPHTDYEAAAPAYTLPAKELYAAFVSDEATAQQTYTGQVIEITGVVSAVEHSNSMVIVLFHFGEGMFGDEGVRSVMLEGYHDKAMQLKEGEEVTLKGFCSGFTGTDVVLEFCSLP